jgi:uncharacterized protein YecE (DUF72 family)
VAGYVDFIEINNSFYRFPAADHAAAWVRRTAHLPGFRFTAKVHQQFTHERRLDAEDWDAFLAGIEPLAAAGRLEALLAQFRYDFDDRSENADTLAWLCARRRGIPLVLELRHRSWQTPEALARIERMGASVATLDYPAGRDGFTLDQCHAGSLRYFRLHGRNRAAWYDAAAGRDQTYNYLYDPDEVKDLARRAAGLARRGRTVLTVANNHYQGKELVTALELKARVLRQPVRVPPLLKQHYPRLSGVEGTARG